MFADDIVARLFFELLAQSVEAQRHGFWRGHCSPCGKSQGRCIEPEDSSRLRLEHLDGFLSFFDLRKYLNAALVIRPARLR
jgi:hypothetical protein